MESWRHTWRMGFAPQMSRDELLTLFTALDARDPAICQGAVVREPYMLPCQEMHVWTLDPVIYSAWITGDIKTVGEALDLFARRCEECDRLLGEPAGCLWFINWWDDTDITIARRKLAREIWCHVYGAPAPWHEQ